MPARRPRRRTCGAARRFDRMTASSREDLAGCHPADLVNRPTLSNHLRCDHRDVASQTPHRLCSRQARVAQELAHIGGHRPMGPSPFGQLRHLAYACAGIALLTGTAGSALAQSWPDRNIQAIVPFAAGAANDIVGRIVLEQVSKQINKPIVVENRPGAGGTIGVTAVGKSPPDGHTLLVHSSSFSSALSLYKSLPYDTLNDFAPVIALGKTPTVLVVLAVQGLQDRRRADRRRQGQAGRTQLRLRRPRLHVASRGRAIPPQRRHPGAAHSVPRAERSLHRTAGWPHRFLFPAARAGAAAGQGGPPDRARGEHRYACQGAARRADHDRARVQGFVLSVLDRRVRAGEDAAGDRRPAARRKPGRHEDSPRCRSGSPRSAAKTCR